METPQITRVYQFMEQVGKDHQLYEPAYNWLKSLLSADLSNGLLFEGEILVRTVEGNAFFDALIAFNASPPPGFKPVQFLE